MKKIIVFLIVLVVFTACSDDRNLGADKGDGLGGSLAVFAIKGNYLYSVDNNKLHVFSIINTDNPVKVNDVEIGFNIETLFSSGEFLYIGSQNGMYIYSLTNPETPTQLAAVQHFTACDPVVANATHAFVTLHSTATCGNWTNSLEVYDIANSMNPVLVHSRNLVSPKGLGLYGNFLFVCDDEIKIFNIENAAQPVLVGALPQVCFDVIISGDVLFAIGDDSVLRYSLNPTDINDITLESTVVF